MLANSTFFKTLDHETLFMHVLALREHAMDSLELLTGNRVNLGWNVVGGVRMDADERHFNAILENLKKIEDGIVFSREGDMVWQCSNCGHIVIGKKAPQICPVCNHPQAFFQIKAENY